MNKQLVWYELQLLMYTVQQVLNKMRPFFVIDVVTSTETPLVLGGA